MRVLRLKNNRIDLSVGQCERDKRRGDEVDLLPLHSSFLLFLRVFSDARSVSGWLIQLPFVANDLEHVRFLSLFSSYPYYGWTRASPCL